MAARADIGGDPNNDDVHIAWKYTYTAKDTWLGPTQNLGSIGSLYCLTMDPFEKYDMTFNGAVGYRALSASPGKYAGEDNGWCLALIYQVIIDFDKSIVKYPSIKRFPGGASNDLVPDLQHPENPLPLIDIKKPVNVKGGGG
jgi:arylsulfatase